MSDIEIVELFQASCYECGWSGEEVTSFRDADAEVESHACDKTPDQQNRPLGGSE